MVRYTVLLFGPAATSLDKDRVSIELPDAGNTESIKSALIHEYPVLEPYLCVGRLAVNSQFVSGDQEIDSDDEMALISMVSGG